MPSLSATMNLLSKRNPILDTDASSTSTPPRDFTGYTYRWLTTVDLSLVRDNETFRSKTTSPTPNAMAKMVMMLLSILKIHSHAVQKGRKAR
mmetsp:Transcript_16534/g.26195  ORF Transcript_16534/g.26195 Transcript_16534/m.26195 type:complete len:92 (-) Transcript_16534:20-295(-)